MAAALLLVLFRKIRGWDHNSKQLNNQQRGQHRRLGKAHGAREDPEAELLASEKRTVGSPICLDTQRLAIIGAPTKWPLCGERRNKRSD